MKNNEKHSFYFFIFFSFCKDWITKFHEWLLQLFFGRQRAPLRVSIDFVATSPLLRASTDLEQLERRSLSRKQWLILTLMTFLLLHQILTPLRPFFAERDSKIKKERKKERKKEEERKETR
jgi:hypothetical protein